jgi:hypothetical protein
LIKPLAENDRNRQFYLEQGLERYQQGESAASLLLEFKQLSDRSPKNAAVCAV